MWRRMLAGAAVLAAGWASPAAALPGDEPFAPVAPDDGATFAPSPAGIPVAYTCPVYRISSAGEGFTVYGGPSDYGVSFATAPDLGTDGRLRSDNVVALDEGHVRNTLPAGQCQSTFDAGGSVRPQETPGTYYWQVWRLCTGCEGSYEVGPVRTLHIRTATRPQLRRTGRAYAGYPVAYVVAADGAPDGSAVTLERRARGRWRSVGSARTLAARAEVIATLPRGAQRLRATVRAGSETLTTPERAVRVRPARRWSTRRADEGVYTGALSVRLRVVRGGREIRDFQADVAMLCPGVVAGQLTTQIGRSALARIRVAPDGTFLAAARLAEDTATLVRGRIRNGRVVGNAQLSVGTCSGSDRFTARR